MRTPMQAKRFRKKQFAPTRHQRRKLQKALRADVGMPYRDGKAACAKWWTRRAEILETT